MNCLKKILDTCYFEHNYSITRNEMEDIAFYIAKLYDFRKVDVYLHIVNNNKYKEVINIHSLIHKKQNHVRKN